MAASSGNLRILVLKWAYSTPIEIYVSKEKEDNSY